jgi:hypothetical protein
MGSIGTLSPMPACRDADMEAALMYSLFVFCDGSPDPVQRLTIAHAADVLAEIPRLFIEHPGCERIEVFLSQTRLFKVDCQGQTSPG